MMMMMNLFSHVVSVTGVNRIVLYTLECESAQQSVSKADCSVQQATVRVVRLRRPVQTT